MSREFGQYCSGYFHNQIAYAAEDCLGGRDALTKLWGKFFQSLEPVAYGIASSEAGDSGPDYAIVENIRQAKELRAALTEIETYLAPYERVQEHAIRDYVEKCKAVTP